MPQDRCPGVTTTFSYDTANRYVGKSFSDGTPGVVFSYDLNNPFSLSSTNTIGRLAGTWTGVSGVWANWRAFSYDQMGRVIKQWDCFPATVDCSGALETDASYDLAGDQASLTYVSGRKVTYTVNNAMQPTQVRFDSFGGTSVGYNYLSAASYAPTGGPTSLTFGSGVTENTSYNKLFQTCNFQVANGTFTWLNRTNNFYPTPGTNCQPGSGANNGNVLSVADNLQSNRTQSFSYDTLNRVASAQTQVTSGPDCWAQSFGYDVWANLLTAAPTRSGCPMTNLNLGFSANNQITNTGVSYDAAGDLLTDGFSTYAYDAESRIKSFNGTGATYTYGPQGQRTVKQVGSDTTQYVYFNGQPIAERKANGDWSDYIYAGSRRLARADTYEDRVLTSGTYCSSCPWQWSIFWFPNAGGLNGYVIQSGDKLILRQWQDTVGARAGIGLWFTDGSNSASVTYDQDGQPTDADTSFQTWHYRRIDLTSEVGKAVNGAGLITQGWTPPGNWYIYYQDIVLVSTDGTVRTLYSHQPSFSLTVAGSPESTRTYQNANGYPTWAGTFLPFGQEWNPQITVNHYKFTSYNRDGESGNDYAMARYFSSQYGRFMSPDPLSGNITDPQSLNRYAYVEDNPENLIDPSGQYLCGTQCDAPPYPGLPPDPGPMVYGTEPCVNYRGPCGSGGQSQMPPKTASQVKPGAPKPQKTILSQICSAIPSGRTEGVSGGLGGVGSVGGGGELVVNYNSGQVSAFGFGGVQIGWNGGASGSVYSGFVYGLNNSNSNYSGGFTEVSGGAGLGGFAASSSGGLTGGGLRQFCC